MGACTISTPNDTNNNAADFIFVDTNGTSAGAGQRLGAPGPQNLSSPIQRNSTFAATLARRQRRREPTRRTGSATSPAIRPTTRRSGRSRSGGAFVNNTGGNVTRLRYRVVDLTTFPAPSGIADLRPRTSVAVVVSGINDAATCAATGAPATPPCTVTVQGTTLEQPPSQPNGSRLQRQRQRRHGHAGHAARQRREHRPAAPERNPADRQLQVVSEHRSPAVARGLEPIDRPGPRRLTRPHHRSPPGDCMTTDQQRDPPEQRASPGRRHAERRPGPQDLRRADDFQSGRRPRSHDVLPGGGQRRHGHPPEERLALPDRPKTMITSIVSKVARAIGRGTRLLARDPRDAALSARMALWVVLASVLARLMPLPLAHRVVSTRVRTRQSVASADVPAHTGPDRRSPPPPRHLHVSTQLLAAGAGPPALPRAPRHRQPRQLRPEEDRRRAAGPCLARARRAALSRGRRRHLRRHLHAAASARDHGIPARAADAAGRTARHSSVCGRRTIRSCACCSTAAGPICRRNVAAQVRARVDAGLDWDRVAGARGPPRPPGRCCTAT